MGTYRVGFNASTKEIKVFGPATNLPNGYADWGSFNYNDDNLLDSNFPVQNHVIYHRLRTIAYKFGQLNMQALKISLDASTSDGTNTAVALVVPSLLNTRYTVPYSFTRTNSGTYASNWNPANEKKAVTVRYYVDPINGLDTNSGLTRVLALKQVSTAMAKADVDEVILINLVDDIVIRGLNAASFQSSPQRSMNIINESTAYRAIMTSSSVTVTPWSQNGTYANVMETTRDVASTGLVDTRFKHYPFKLTTQGTGYAINDSLTLNNGAVIKILSVTTGNGIGSWSFLTGAYLTIESDTLTVIGNTGSGTDAIFTNIRTAPKAFSTAVKVGSQAVMAATRGTWFDDGVKTYYNPINGVVATGTISKIVLTSGSAAALNLSGATNQANIYLENFDMVGSLLGINSIYSSTSKTDVHTFVNCTSQGNQGNGLSTASKAQFKFKNCGAYYNGQDGFSLHNNAGTGTTGQFPVGYYDTCTTIGNGTIGSALAGTSDNDWTGHEDTVSILQNCNACGSDDRVFGFIDTAYVWMMGGYIGSAKQATTEVTASNFDLSGTGAVGWLDGVQVPNNGSIRSGGTSETYNVVAGNTLNYRNMNPIPASSGGGTLATY